ncbi:MAG: bifunctional UDP-N-acetylglucosamine diphosphorylase/glucosamine-1-phosphate N-acetyltransferase GlmU [Alphaproteobacteria bacterium]|nr:bifunctional UDP-N-acetylglucosamine diphosphorylase/glucosamine-1-phosphate N-acetyltransferase GlmU [Alphaproteobacteria bacterium]
MTKQVLAVVILAAGLGTRMKSTRPKVMHPLAGRPMISHLLATVASLDPDRVVVVTGPDMPDLAVALTRAPIPVTTVVQQERRGTGHAVATARAVAAGADDVLVLLGDVPLVGRESLARLIAARRAAPEVAVAVLGMRPVDPTGYGRLLTGADGMLERIVEELDASPAERQIGLCNAGLMAIDGRRLWALLAQLQPDNAKGELYLTDIIQAARAAGLVCRAVEGTSADELIGINSRVELAQAEGFLQARLRAAAMRDGATLLDPDSVYFSHDTRLGRDVEIGQNVVFGPGVTIADGAQVRPFCHLEGVSVASGAVIGPFARLRPGTVVAEGARIGNFVETKNAAIAAGAKVNHLSYVGDASVGAGANVGAGTITCNYDGFDKARTEIGAGAFIGSNSSLIAPVKIGAGAFVAAGSVVTEDVAPDSLAVARGTQAEKPGWAAAFRARKAAEKAARKARKTKQG